MTVCSCHVTYAFQSESTLYSCLNIKELLARYRCENWSLSDCNWNRTQNHLTRKRTHNHLAKWLSVRLPAKWFWAPVQLVMFSIRIYSIYLHFKAKIVLFTALRPSNNFFNLKKELVCSECLFKNLLGTYLSLQKKWSFLLGIFSVNMTKSAVSCGFGHIYWKSP